MNVEGETKLVVEHYWPDELPEGTGWVILRWANFRDQCFGHHTAEAESIYEKWLRDLEELDNDYYSRINQGDLYGRVVPTGEKP
jgi:hypothetical protein